MGEGEGINRILGCMVTVHTIEHMGISGDEKSVLFKVR
jgi:hypothetical protein